MVACYFAYGSNMNPERVRARGIEFFHASGARLAGYTLAFDKAAKQHAGVGHANLIYAPGACAEGVLYWLTAATEIAKMDRFESAPVNYSREVVLVQIEADELPDHLADGTTADPVPTWTYFANRAVRQPNLVPPRSYLNHLLAGKPFLSADYYSMLERWPCEESR